jgi:hypothetical protein
MRAYMTIATAVAGSNTDPEDLTVLNIPWKGIVKTLVNAYSMLKTTGRVCPEEPEQEPQTQ